MSNLNVDTVTAANVMATGMVTANTAMKAPNYADAGKPASADPGSVIYNTTQTDLELWKGSFWLSLGAGNLRTWTTDTRPASPSTGSFGFNTQTSQAEIWNGSDWVFFGSAAGDANADLFDFTSFTFKSIVSKGEKEGPTFSQMQSEYAGQPWLDGTHFKMGNYQGYQVWTVPADATYTIEAGGAIGGKTNNYSYDTYWGAKISGQFTLTKGTEIEMIVGVGGDGYGCPHGNEAGGGGGSFVINKSTSQLMLVAGGGGGSASSTHGWSCGRSSSWSYGKAGETAGSHGCWSNPGNCQGNGYGGCSWGSHQGAAGGGYNSDGYDGSGHCCQSNGGGNYTNGLKGGHGHCCYTGGGENNSGGFGGGGGGGLSGPGGAGGYTGGTVSGYWSSWSTGGGGGGSYNQGQNQQNTQGGNNSTDGGTYTGNGYVKITKG